MPTAEDDYNRDEIIEMTPAQDPMAALAQLAGLAPAAPQPANGFREIAARQDIGMLPHADPRALEPGDILFGRGSKPISLVISLLNGYWSHSAIYYGGPDRLVVHASVPGIISEPIESFLSHYPPTNVGFARPVHDPETRQAAADWAYARSRRATAEDALAIESSPYSGRDLGLAAALLVRATLGDFLGWGKGETTEPHDLLDQLTIDDSLPVVGRDEHWTCAGLVFDAYQQDAAAPVWPVFLSTIRLNERELVVRGKDGDDLSIPDVSDTNLLDVFGWARRQVAGFGSKTRDRIETWRSLSAIVSAAVPELRHAPDVDTGMQIVSAVGPNDLWHSADVAHWHVLVPGSW